jgi:hypothetical protein
MTHCNSVHLTNVRPDPADVRRWYISASGGKVLRLGTTEVPLEPGRETGIGCGGHVCDFHVSCSWAFWSVVCMQNIQERFFCRRFQRFHTVSMALARHF